MRQFNSTTFVCFLDISGFKRKLAQNINVAVNMLDTFYSAGYSTLKEYESLNGIFVSDCGIIYPDKGTPTQRLESILKSIKKINELMLDNNFLTTASIAYGHLEYRKKFTFERIKKNAVLGNGYINAFLDNESNENKIYAGQVRITKKVDEANADRNIFEKLDFSSPTLRFLEDTETHYYHHWYSPKTTDKEYVSKIYEKLANGTNVDKFDILIKELQDLRNNNINNTI